MNKQKPKISLIAAIGSQNRVLANEKGEIPWHISEDFKYFKEITMGHPIIMGRKTFETFPRPLPGQPHVVISRLEENFLPPVGIFSASSIKEALTKAADLDKEEIFIIGGGQIYKQSIAFADRLYLTIVETDMKGPVVFPEYSKVFSKTISSRKSSDENFNYEFVILEK